MRSLHSAHHMPAGTATGKLRLRSIATLGDVARRVLLHGDGKSSSMAQRCSSGDCFVSECGCCAGGQPAQHPKQSDNEVQQLLAFTPHTKMLMQLRCPEPKFRILPPAPVVVSKHSRRAKSSAASYGQSRQCCSASRRLKPRTKRSKAQVSLTSRCMIFHRAHKMMVAMLPMTHSSQQGHHQRAGARIQSCCNASVRPKQRDWQTQKQQRHLTAPMIGKRTSLCPT